VDLAPSGSALPRRAFRLSSVRFAIPIALGLVLAVVLAAGAVVISRDDAAQPRIDRPAAVKPTEPAAGPRARKTAGPPRRRTQVTAPVDHRSREGIEEAEVDSHGNVSRADG
jgi:hypothetical protein